jgi:hypothetical protein
MRFGLIALNTPLEFWNGRRSPEHRLFLTLKTKDRIEHRRKEHMLASFEPGLGHPA